MKRFVLSRIYLAMLMLWAACQVGCKPLHVDWPAVVACAGPISQGLVAAVEAILKQDGSSSELGPDALAALEQLAGQYGASTIVCVIESLIDSWLPSTGEAASPDNARAARRAQAFLNAKGITVEATQ